MRPTTVQVLTTAIALLAATLIGTTTNAGAAWAAFGFIAYHIARMTPRPGQAKPNRYARPGA